MHKCSDYSFSLSECDVWLFRSPSPLPVNAYWAWTLHCLGCPPLFRHLHSHSPSYFCTNPAGVWSWLTRCGLFTGGTVKANTKYHDGRLCLVLVHRVGKLTEMFEESEVGANTSHLRVCRAGIELNYTHFRLFGISASGLLLQANMNEKTSTSCNRLSQKTMLTLVSVSSRPARGDWETDEREGGGSASGRKGEHGPSEAQ